MIGKERVRAAISFGIGILLVALVLASSGFNAVARADVLTDVPRFVPGRSFSASSVNLGKDGLPDPAANGDCHSIVEPGEKVVIADLKGPGVITHIWFTINQFTTLFGEPPRGRARGREVLIRIYYDGREKPDVEAPFTDFFAQPFGKHVAVNSAPVIVEDGDSYNCYWQMPFRKSARIEVVNQSKKPLRALFYAVDWIKRESLPKDTMYFCARYRQEFPTKLDPTRPDSEYLILDTEGAGYYVGTVLSVRSRSPDWFGEGDIRMAVDGEKVPSIWGTGTEDYFLSAWCLKECSTPFFGTTYLSHKAQDVGQMSSCYRWHIRDPIVFNKGLRVSVEMMGFTNADENPEHNPRKYDQREDDVCSMAYWYQIGPSKQFARTTTAEERKYPCLDPIIAWGKDFAGEKHHGRGEAKMWGPQWYWDTDQVLKFVPESMEDSWIELSFEVKKKEPYRLIAVLEKAPDGGIYQPIFNGVKIGEPIDLYAPKPLYQKQPMVDDINLMDFWPEPGKYTMRLECVGRNPRSSGTSIGVNSVRLRERRPRAKQAEFLKDYDWRKKPVLIDFRVKELPK
ncbi:MAG: DUF2961 domain-containing protein [Pirellulales bacterium]|nr:DUF2961 domain-containing protein [Pirellulales bacterium]